MRAVHLPPAPRPVPANAPERVRLPEILSALSHALDLTEGQPQGHTLRSCAIGMRLGREWGLGEAELSALYYALLLKDAGCSSNAHRFASVFGTDDRAAKYRMKFADWHRRGRLALRTATVAGAGRAPWARVRVLAGIARTPDVTRDLIQVRCDRGASIARQLGFPERTAEAIRSLDEHWNGGGYPDGRAGEEIPVLSRIINLAQCVEIFHHRRGVRAALRVARERRGTWFDPRLAGLLLAWKGDAAWWKALGAPELLERVVAAEPGGHGDDGAEVLETVAGAFAEIVDAKSPYTFQHSTNVAAYAVRMGEAMGMEAGALRYLNLAGLLHDIGKLGVSNRILEKPGRLDDAERREVERHPLHTWEILSRVNAFAAFARTAAVHHEKLDGSGYPWGLSAPELDAPARVLAVADIYEALTADRPYRAGMPVAKALSILRAEAPTRVCGEAVDALAACVA